MRENRFKLNRPPKGSVALITGAGSGIGRCYAARLSAMGYDLALVDINRDAVQETAQQISAARSDCRVAICAMDLAKSDSAESIIEWCREERLQPTVLINNAGIFAFCDTIELEMATIERLLMLHCMTLTKLSRHFAKEMSATGKGGYILNMSSYSQWMPFPGISLYGASKSYVRGFSVGLSKEVEERGVVVTAISPAGVATPLYGLPDTLQRLGVRVGALITADSCARRGLKALGRGRRHVVPDWWNMIFIPFLKYMPRFIERGLRRKTMRFQKRV